MQLPAGGTGPFPGCTAMLSPQVRGPTRGSEKHRLSQQSGAAREVQAPPSEPSFLSLDSRLRERGVFLGEPNLPPSALAHCKRSAALLSTSKAVLDEAALTGLRAHRVPGDLSVVTRGHRLY